MIFFYFKLLLKFFHTKTLKNSTKIFFSEVYDLEAQQKYFSLKKSRQKKNKKKFFENQL